MSESVQFEATANRDKKYAAILPQLKSIVEGEADLIANLANFSAVIKEVFEFLWVGFYLVKNKELVLGPYQGPLACTRIAFGKGVCGTAWKEKRNLIVPDVNLFPGHIACSSRSKSEIAIPLFDDTGEVWAILDIDSEILGDFSEMDSRFLTAMTRLLNTF
jgi:L-methionine (R)-S-oxide reductase